MSGWARDVEANGTIKIQSDWVGGVQADIETLEGKMHADNGDFIIRGINGEIYPCKPDVFEKTYEQIEGD